MVYDGRKQRFKYRCVSVIDELPHLKDKLRYENNISKLNHDLLEVYKKIALKNEECNLREDIFKRFKKAIEMEFEKLRIKVNVGKYGSFMTGLMVGQSDIDITILFPEVTEEEEKEGKYLPYSYSDVNEVLKNCFKMLLKHDLCVGEIVHIKKTKIPILKCIEKEYDIKIDISVGMTEGVSSGEFVCRKLQEYKDLKYLCILVKYFLKRRNLSMCYTGGLSAYAQFLLVLNFIQLHPLSDAANIKDNIGTYLMDFFLFYGEFNYSCALVDVKNIRYKVNTSRELFIDDPVVDGLKNVAAKCSQFDKIQNIFMTSYKIMAKALSMSIHNKDICHLWFKFNTKELYDREQNIKKYIENKQDETKVKKKKTKEVKKERLVRKL
ncbi:PAPD7 [Ecytonucleospora hepatopenaei]|uniref:PAPD7 n=1 Tax=Ecytonucleospora hepatopenaei TaxID=646526 RepID=A0A1W0E5C6_9MICR|nr:PAPD7 [Ecytonucleospora hepatopenaei]